MVWDPELAIVAGRIDLLLDAVRASRSIAARRFARDALARGLLLADPGAVPEAQRDAARLLMVDASTIAAAAAPRQPHAVAVPLVARRWGVGLVRQVQVAFDPVGLLVDEGRFDPDARRAISLAIRQAAERAPPPSDPALHRLVLARPDALADVRVAGRSLAAATFVSAVALWRESVARADVVITGALEGDAVVSVGEMDAKVCAAHAHGSAAIIVPASDAAEAARVASALGERAKGLGPLRVIPVESADGLLAASLVPRSAARVPPERAVDEARAVFATGWRGYQWPSVREHLARLSSTLPARRVDLRVSVLTQLAAAQRNLGDPVGSLGLLREANALVLSEEGRRAVPDGPITHMWQHIAMTCRQLCRFGEAARAADRALGTARRARLRGEVIKALGCVGLVAKSRGKVGAAIDAFEASLEVTRAHDPHRSARTHAYLIEAYGAAGDLERARHHFDEAMRDVEGSTSDPDRLARESWVRTSWGGALLRLGRPAEAISALDAPAVRTSLEEEPLPGLFARRHLGLALAADGQAERGYEVLAASPVVHGRALEPHLAFFAHLNVLAEAHARLGQGAFGPDILGRARSALLHVPRYDRVPAFLGRPLTRTRDMLSRDTPPRSRADLGDLIARCERLA